MGTRLCAIKCIKLVYYKECLHLILVVWITVYLVIPFSTIFSMGLILQYFKNHYCMFYMTCTDSKSKLYSSKRRFFPHNFKSSLQNSAEPLQISFLQHTRFRKRWDFFLSVDTYHTCIDISCFDICICMMSLPKLIKESSRCYCSEKLRPRIKNFVNPYLNFWSTES